MYIQNLVIDGLEHDRIRELYLYKIPVMKTVNNWNDVKEVGSISFKGKHANYNGGLISYKTKIYFITQSTMSALSTLRKWKFKKRIQVVSESEWKVKVTEFQKNYSSKNKGYHK